MWLAQSLRTPSNTKLHAQYLRQASTIRPRTILCFHLFVLRIKKHYVFDRFIATANFDNFPEVARVRFYFSEILFTFRGRGATAEFHPAPRRRSEAPNCAEPS